MSFQSPGTPRPPVEPGQREPERAFSEASAPNKEIVDGGPSDGRFAAMVVSGVLALALGLTAASLPVPYAVESPGPTFNTLGMDGDKPVIHITGHETFPAKGRLDLTTVYVDGGPNGPVTIFEAFRAWLDSSQAVYPEELVFPKGTTREESQQQSALAMATSQENATASALKELKIPFEQKLRITELAEGSPSEGKLQADDILVSINGKPITALSVVQNELAAGKGSPVTVEVNRGGSTEAVTVTPSEVDSGKYVLGVLLKYEFKFPFEVQISLEKVGGPSAGPVAADLPARLHAEPRGGEGASPAGKQHLCRSLGLAARVFVA
jgi:PDZ domain-containing protein